MARMEIRGEQHTVGEVFSERYIFSVPAYQRSYLWKTEHAGQLLHDLQLQLGDANTPEEDVSPYFLGTIVLIKGDGPKSEIVDGQQRLISLTILLAALRSFVPPEFAESITRRLHEPADPLNHIPAQYRLRPKERDVAFLQQYVQTAGGIQRLKTEIHPDLTESQRNMQVNAALYLSELSKLSAEDCVRFAKFILHSCSLIVVSTPDLNSAYRIFSVLNNRGLDLTIADLLKAEVIGPIPSELRQDYTERWEGLEDRLGSNDFSEFFSHLRTIYRGLRRATTIIDEFRAYVMPAAQDAEHLIDDIVLPLGKAYHTIKHPQTYDHADAQDADDVRLLLGWLNRIDNSDWIPPALMYLARHHDQPARLKRFLEALERLAASLMIRRQYAHRRQPRYAQLIQFIERDEVSQPGSPIHLLQQERDETINALGGDLYLMAATPRNYTLQRLDSSLAGLGATYKYDVITVEHVLPRNPSRTSEWVRAFPTEEIRARWVHRIGNLVLLTREKNRQAYNYDFSTKKMTYFVARNGVSPFALTTQVLREDEWTPQVVERRQRELMEHLRTFWHL